ncbi:type II toxin-antitoxin system RelE/ParE family toxin [Candidatus Peregrinibacteria bacterium]|jgi:mRNA interferase RelE/StbE|nr:type II toxin-antitoxin system RelE/ParE family toxin [Candidatus Peregrinibacteria bacterium]MBT4366017.1 type II toxin-antitoxin system RelE/ParE family toxin [Candidatus Peregrinibacteria bacterium]MBT4456373.1 type II toxin-antitoxin system RelE/ParE family toxin [Candidatus Peregrinibacteria bacterium]
MIYSIEYHGLVVREDIPRLGKKEKDRVRKSIESKLVSAPETFGKPLRRSLKGYRSLRVGDYRVVFKIVGKVVRVLAIKHRSKVYEEVENVGD